MALEPFWLMGEVVDSAAAELSLPVESLLREWLQALLREITPVKEAR